VSVDVEGRAVHQLPTRTRVPGTVLIIVVGLLNFHIPHFLFQDPGAGGRAGYVLELGLVLNVAAAVVAAVGIVRRRGWGWILGMIVAGVSLALWLAQETVGLPGLPQAWTEPSRLVAVMIETAYLILASRQLIRRR
jgi:hypothetical protein